MSKTFTVSDVTDIDLSSILNKLERESKHEPSKSLEKNSRPGFTGHRLEEIRVRALHNILSKIEHGIICEADLLQQQQLYIQLLEWFNYDKCSHQLEVLQLIRQLTKHDSAVKQFLQIGAVDFLSKLRANCEDGLQPVIDDIQESLLSLRSHEQLMHRRECIFQHHSVLKKENASNTLEDRQLSCGVMRKAVDNQGYFPQTSPSVSKGVHTNDRIASVNSGVGCVKGLKFSTFPWLSLTPTDRHVLISTNSSLCSPRPSIVLTSCEFVSGVVLQDFPAEIFLQRPNITKSLLSLLGLKPLSIGDNSIALSAIKCLRELSTLLLSRHKFYHDPALYCPKQDFGSQTASTASSGMGRASCSTSQSTLSTGSRPSVIGRNEPRVRGDGRDGDTSSSVHSSPVVADITASVSDTDSEDAIVLQFSQLTLPQFATDVLFHVTPLLKTGTTEVVVASVYLLNEAMKLVRVAMTTDIWDDGSAAGRALTDKLSDSFEVLGEVLHYHYHHCHGDHDGEQSIPVGHVSKETFVHHRLSMIAIITLVKTVIQDLVPFEKAKDILPENLSSSLYLAVMDEGLMFCTPHVRVCLLPIIQRSLPAKHRLYQEAANICSSMNSASLFLQELDDKCTNAERLLNLAEASLSSLHCHRVLSLVDKFVQLCSDICSSSNEKNVKYSRKILLKFLAHPEQDVKLQTYAACLNIVKDVVNVEEVIRGRRRAAECIHFLLDSNILYEICCFGLSDDQEKCCRQGEDMMLHLLQGQHLMGCTTWSMFLQACVPVLPVLQALVSEKSPLSNCIVGLLQPTFSRTESKEFEMLSHLEKLRGSLRLLFCQDQCVRLEGAKAVMYYLTQETSSSLKLPSVDTYTLNDIADLLLFDHAVHLDVQNSGRSVFQVEGLYQVFHIFTATDTEASLRKSALEQIAIILQDGTLHKAFLSQGGLDKVLDCMKKATMSADETRQEMLPMIPACLCILRHILHEDPSLRHELAHQDYIYYLLIRAGLLCYPDCRARYHTAHVTVLLLFDEVASLTVSEHQLVNQFTLPKCVSQKFKLPFRCMTAKSHSPYRKAYSSADDPLNKSCIAWRMLRIAWNVAWYGGIQSLMDKIESGLLKESHPSFNSKIALTAEDKLLLRCSHSTTSLKQCLQSVCQASSHYTVKVSLWRLALWLLTNMLMHNVGETDRGRPDITEFLLQLEFRKALDRFIGVVPVSVDDKILLTEVLSFIVLLMKSLSPKPSCTDFLHWLGNVSCSPKSVLIGLLTNSKPEDREVERQDNQRHGEVESSADRTLHKQLVTFFGCYIQCLPLSGEAWRRKTGFLGGCLTHGLLLSLNSADAAHFYDLPSLENTLHCLVHVTARPGWSLDWRDGDSLSLCQHLLNSLLEVISAFHVGRGGTAMSYMGKGVTKSAAVCLCHLAHEMANRAHQKNWSTEWFYTRQRQEGLAEIGLGWLIPLWSNRDPEVRAAGLGIAAVLSSSESGRVTMTKGCQHLPGGLWAVALGVLSDQSECSIVRRQAALLFVNLLSERLPEGDSESHNDRKETWIGPLVHDQQSQLCLSGLPGLHALMEHYNIYQGLKASLNHFYGQATIQPVSIVEESTTASSSIASGLSTATTPDVGSCQSYSSFTSPDIVGQTELINDPQVFSASADSFGLSASSLLTLLSNQGSSKSSSSQSARGALTIPNTSGRYVSVVTPSLVSSICRLLHNLLALSPQDTVVSIDRESILSTLIRLVDVDGICSLLHHLALSPGPKHNKTYLQLVSHLSMCCDIFRLFQAYKQSQNQCKQAASLDDKSVFMLGCRVLSLSSTDATDSDIWKQIHEVWETVLMFMVTHLTLYSHVGRHDISSAILSHWASITGAIIHIMKSPVASSTRIVALNFLANFLNKMHGRRSKEVWKEETEPSSQDDGEDANGDDMMTASFSLDDERKDAGCETSSGSLLCSVLLQAFDGTLSRTLDSIGALNEKTNVIYALRNLLAISHQAKKTAVKNGLIESVLDSMQHTHAKLNVECLQHPRPAAKKKEEPLLTQLIGQMSLLQNCLCNNQEAKINSLEAGLTSVLLKLWSWSILDKRLLAATLSLLATYTANCIPACTSLAQCHPGQSGSSLLHRIIQQIDSDKKQVTGQSRDSQQQIKGLFVTLSNSIISAECRNALWKSGFLQTFSQVCTQRKQTCRGGPLTGKQLSAVLWLQLLANLTLSPEGQQMVMRIPDVLELLFVLGESVDDDVSNLATLTLHNLCFLSANKPKLLASEKILPFFEKKLNCGNRSAQNMVVNALWALLYESQKAKAILKSSTVCQWLIDAQCQTSISSLQPLTLSSRGQSGQDNDLHQNLSSVLALMID